MRIRQILSTAALAGVLPALIGLAPPAQAQVVDDFFTAATIVSTTTGTLRPGAMFDGSNVYPGSSTVFPDLGTGSEAEVVFDTAPIALAGIHLHAANDGADFSWDGAMNRFQFFADMDQDGVLAPSERLVDQSIDIDYSSGQAGDLDTTPREIEFAFAFPTTTAHRWKVVVTQGVNAGLEGPRVQEVDAVAAPAPTTLVADPPVQGLLTLSARLTQTGSGAPIPGETVVMSTSAGPICQAVTGVDGVAACGGLGALLQIVGENGYTASFAGSGQFLASSARATLLTGGSGSSVTTTVPAGTPAGSPATTTPSAGGTLASTGDVRGVAEWGLVLLVAGLGGVTILSARRRPGA